MSENIFEKNVGVNEKKVRLGSKKGSGPPGTPRRGGPPPPPPEGGRGGPPRGGVPGGVRGGPPGDPWSTVFGRDIFPKVGEGGPDPPGGGPDPLPDPRGRVGRRPPIYLNTGTRGLRTPVTWGNNGAEGGDFRHPNLD